MGFDWYEDDDATLAGTSYTLSTTAGSASAAIELHCWLNKGSSVGSPETRYLRVYVEDPASPGTYRTSGLDVLDRREIEARIVGSQNPDLVPGFVAAPTAWKPLGTRRTIPVPEIYPNCAIEWEFRINPTTEGGNSSPVTFRVRAVQGVHVDGEILIPEDVTVDGNLDFQGYTLSNVILDQAGPMDASGYGIENLNRSGTKTDAASVEVVFGRSVKRPCRAAATADVVWDDVADNGTFTAALTPWTGTNWAHSAGTALHTAGATDPLTEDVTIVSGVTYRITVTVTGAAGTVTPSIGAVNGTAIAAGAGTVTQRIVAGAGGTLALAFTPTTDFDGALDDVICERMFYGLVDVDGISPSAGQRVLLTAQDEAAEVGCWYESATAWSRPLDNDDSYQVYPGILVVVTEGTNKGIWVNTGAWGTEAWALVVALP